MTVAAMTAGLDKSDPLAWRRDTFRSPADFTLALSDAEQREIRSALAALARAQRLEPATELVQADFTFTRLADRLRDAYRELRDGRGFVLLRGLPVDGLSQAEFIAAVWGIGTHLGRPLSQNAQGDLIGHVLDASGQDATPRMYRSALELRLHNDVTAMIGLACWQRAESGGASFLASVRTIHDVIAARDPALLALLQRGFHYHRLGEEAEGEAPVTPYRMPVFVERDGQLSCRYQRAGIAAGHRALGLILSDEELAALDMFDAVAGAPETRVAFRLERGDMVLVNNYTVLHARTRFTEFAEPERRRHLIRLWLDQDGFRSVPPELNLFGVNGVPPQPGRHCSFDFKQLYGDDPRATGGLPQTQIDAAELTRAGSGPSR